MRNISELRDFVAEQLQRLCEGSIKPEMANSCAMLAANMLLSVKLEMEYCKMVKKENPKIDFMEKSKSKLIDLKPEKKK